MAITIEGFTVVAQLDRIQDLLENDSFESPRRSIKDDELWKCSFMAQDDAENLLALLASHELNVDQGPDSDAVLVSEFDQSVSPYCEWLQIGEWEKAVIAWKSGTDPRTVVAPEGWDPQKGSGLIFHEQESENLEFLRIDGGVEVYLNKSTGEEVFIGRSKVSVEARYKTASRAIFDNMLQPGQPPLDGELASEVSEAVKMLEELLVEGVDTWQVHFILAKGQVALGGVEEAYPLMKKATEIAPEEEVCFRELGAICLEMGNFEEGVLVCEKAVSLRPQNHESLGNLSVAYLMAGRIDEAVKTIAYAMKLNEDDQVNRGVQSIISDVKNETRPMPQTMEELRTPFSRSASPVEQSATKKRFWEFWK